MTKLERKITEEEVSVTLLHTKNNVAPGPGGFGGSFYKLFWKYLKRVVVGAIGEIYENKELPLSQRLGIIALIPKSDKDPRFIKNWRPLTLLETFYKLISATLANRIKPVLNTIIGHHQKAYVPGRYIAECTRNTYDLFSHAKSNNLPGMMLLIDFEKAFDSVDFGFLVATLEMFGFGEYFVNWIKIILGCNMGTNFRGVTVVNGNISTPFNISRGCRQGDPISGYLFILAMEILALLLKKNKSIKPYRTKFGLEHFIDMYADDLSVYLEFKKKNKFENKRNIKNVLQTLDKFKEWSGLSINLGKTNLTVFGKLVEKPSFVDELNIKWCVEFKLLGIHFDSTLERMYVNYDIALEAVRKEINSWKYRFLTIYGKVTVIKSLCIPKINHIVAVVPSFSIAHLKVLESELKFFILDGNPNVVDEKTRKMAVKDGGFGIPNINLFWKSIRMSWLRRLIGSEATWAKLHKYEVAPFCFIPAKQTLYL